MKRNKIISITIVLIFSLTVTDISSLSVKTKQPPLTDNQYRQANVPPVISVLMDIPSYGKKELFDWGNFIQANTMEVYKNRKKNEEMEMKMYKERLKRMGMLRAKLDRA